MCPTESLKTDESLIFLLSVHENKSRFLATNHVKNNVASNNEGQYAIIKMRPKMRRVTMNKL